MTQNNDLIIIKRSDDTVEAKKGGVWKIAHADFMTAMMAFFLIMWLVNATDEEIKKSIANYFNPMNLTQAPSSQKGLHDPDDDNLPPASGDEAGQPAGSRPMGANAPGDGGGAGGGGNVEEGDERRMDSAGVRNETDGATFHDPYATLASTAMDIDPDVPTAIDVPNSTVGATAETVQSEETRDPFDPTYWQTRQTRPAQTLRPGRESADLPAPNAQIDVADARPRGPDDVVNQPVATVEASSDETAEGGVEASASVADAQREIIDVDALRTVGPRSSVAEAILAAAQPQGSPADEGTEPTAAQTSASAAANELRQALAEVSADVSLTEGAESVRISLTDENTFSMFEIGSAVPNPRTRELFATIAEILKARDGRIVVRGHTDARPFRDRSSDNWTLSFERAHATKTALVANGISETRIAGVEGLADRELTVAGDPYADANRRIEILYEPLTETP